MRTYRAAIPAFRYSKMEQPPLDGPEWPRVVGTPLSSMRGLGQANVARAEGWSFLVFPVLTAASFWLGRSWKWAYFASAFFAVASAEQAFRRWQS